jgi:hypothetical protein
MAADPDRPFACWSIPAQLIAICLLEEFVDDDHIWGQISNRKLVDSDDRNVIRDLLDRPGRPVERTSGGWTATGQFSHLLPHK